MPRHLRNKTADYATLIRPAGLLLLKAARDQSGAGENQAGDKRHEHHCPQDPCGAPLISHPYEHAPPDRGSHHPNSIECTGPHPEKFNGQLRIKLGRNRSKACSQPAQIVVGQHPMASDGRSPRRRRYFGPRTTADVELSAEARPFYEMIGLRSGDAHRRPGLADAWPA